MSAPEPCRLLSWDTQFFGLRIAAIEADMLTPTQVTAVDQWCTVNRIDCLYFLARADEADTMRLAEANGYRLVDVRLILEYTSERLSAKSSGSDSSVQIRLAQPGDMPALRKIARTSHRDTRFYYDEKFMRDSVDALYETWITRSCDGWAEAVLVAEREDLAVGYVSCHLAPDNATGRIGLMAVRNALQRQGIGPTLIMAAVDWFARNKAQSIIVATQARNVSAQRLYQRCGFITNSVGLWYHKWFI